MVALVKPQSSSMAAIARAVAARLVSVRDWGSSSFINLPLIYPGGGFVTIKLEQVKADTFKVSDNGFAFREIESIGAQRSFAKTALGLVEPMSVVLDRRAISTEASSQELERAICDVAMASWQVADRICNRPADEDEGEIEEYLKDRLSTIFGPEKVESDCKIVGVSTTEWELSAIVSVADHRAVFHAVSNHGNSVYRTSAAFHDLAALDKPPTLTSVVRSKKALGPWLSILAQAGNVIEEEQGDPVYRKAA